MTTIAFDGYSLASDRRSTTGNGIVEVTKIERVGKYYFAGAGSASTCELCREWIAAGADTDDRPERPDSGDEGGTAFLIDPTKKEVWLIDAARCTFILKVTHPHAIGSGGDFARAAMALGKNAEEAVALAARLDSYTGNGIDVVDIFKRPKPAKKR
jgi:hypothetical protein